MKGSEKQIKWASDILDTMISGIDDRIEHRKICIKEYEKTNNETMIADAKKIIELFEGYKVIYNSMRERDAKEIIDQRNSEIFSLSLLERRVIRKVDEK